MSVPPERLERWLDGFAARHGPTDYDFADDRVLIRARDGAEALLSVSFPPSPATDRAGLLVHTRKERTVGALLVRRGGVAIGVFRQQELIASTIETGYVQGRTKAGGWSQQRYARRRDQQARRLWSTAADRAAQVLLPRIGELDAVATGGDPAGLAEVLNDPRLGPLQPLVLPRIHPVPDPRLAVLRSFPDQFLAVEIRLNERA